MSDIVPYGGFAPVGIRTARAISQIQHQESLQIRRQDARAAAYENHVGNGLNLAYKAVMGLTALNQAINQATTDKPGLELGLRQMEQVVQLSIAQKIAEYME